MASLVEQTTKTTEELTQEGWNPLGRLSPDYEAVEMRFWVPRRRVREWFRLLDGLKSSRDRYCDTSLIEMSKVPDGGFLVRFVLPLDWRGLEEDPELLGSPFTVGGEVLSVDLARPYYGGIEPPTETVYDIRKDELICVEPCDLVDPLYVTRLQAWRHSHSVNEAPQEPTVPWWREGHGVYIGILESLPVDLGTEGGVFTEDEQLVMQSGNSGPPLKFGGFIRLVEVVADPGNGAPGGKLLAPSSNGSGSGKLFLVQYVNGNTVRLAPAAEGPGGVLTLLPGAPIMIEREHGNGNWNNWSWPTGLRVPIIIPASSLQAKVLEEVAGIGDGGEPESP